MRELITKKDKYSDSEFLNDFTAKLDNSLNTMYQKGRVSYRLSYLNDIKRAMRHFDEEHIEIILVAFRYCGATRGHIALNRDLIIEDIEFYENCCYVYSKTKELIKEFIGTKIVIEED